MSIKGFKMTEEHKQKIGLANSIALKGRIPWNKGKKMPPHSEKHKRKISESNKGHIVTEETRKKIGKANTGKKHSEESIKRQADALRGRKQSPETIAKRIRFGSQHYNWKGGFSPKLSRLRHSQQYNEWRLFVYKKDDFTCQKCGHRFVSIVAHHIKCFNEFEKLRFDINNGKVLCRSCHGRLHQTKKSNLYKL